MLTFLLIMNLISSPQTPTQKNVVACLNLNQLDQSRK